ncbi:MAG: TSUP family transporter, partial [Patescibacteria group bacterium]
VSKKNKKIIIIPLGLISGIIDSLIGIGGIPIILYFNRQEINKTIFRATCVASFVILAFSRTVAYTYTGFINAEVIKITAFLIPGVIIGSLIGIKLHNAINEELFSKIVLLILLIVGLLLLIK